MLASLPPSASVEAREQGLDATERRGRRSAKECDELAELDAVCVACEVQP